MRVILGTWGRLFVRPDSEAVYIDFGIHRIYRGEQCADLTRGEMRLATAILSKRGTIATSAEIHEALWGGREDGGPLLTRQVASVHALRIRRKLAPLGIRFYTEWGEGYSSEVGEPYEFQAEQYVVNRHMHPGLKAQNGRLPKWVHGDTKWSP